MGKVIAAITIFLALAAGALLAVDRAAAVGAAGVKPGAPAPGFTAPDISGRMVNLGQYAGQIVILEWTNDGCPFVQKHYDSANMQTLQRRYTQEGVIWLTIASSAPGEEGYVTPAAAQADLARWQAPLRRAGDAAHGGDRPQRQNRLHGRDRRHPFDPPRRRQDRQELSRRRTR